jgi:hypothetical protein
MHIIELHSGIRWINIMEINARAAWPSGIVSACHRGDWSYGNPTIKKNIINIIIIELHSGFLWRFPTAVSRTPASTPSSSPTRRERTRPRFLSMFTECQKNHILLFSSIPVTHKTNLAMSRKHVLTTLNAYICEHIRHTSTSWLGMPKEKKFKDFFTYMIYKTIFKTKKIAELRMSRSTYPTVPLPLSYKRKKCLIL